MYPVLEQQVPSRRSSSGTGINRFVSLSTRCGSGWSSFTATWAGAGNYGIRRSGIRLPRVKLPWTNCDS